MSKPKIVCVVPSIRPESMEKFREAWAGLFEKHEVTLVTVWDGGEPELEVTKPDGESSRFRVLDVGFWREDRDLFYRFTDSCRNIGFVYAAQASPDYILTLDDDVLPDKFLTHDPILGHINALKKSVPLGWMNTVDYQGCEEYHTFEYMRGVPYNIRDEAPVMLSHGVWSGTPDLDGETQLRHTWGDGSLPSFGLTFHVGPIPRGVLFPLCGMNVMVRREALPYLYYAPMGPDTEIRGLNRFGDIWMGVFLKRKFDELGWACYTGGSTVLHSRASNARKNYEQEKLGREWNEDSKLFGPSGDIPLAHPAKVYMTTYTEKRTRYADLITSILNGGQG